MTWRAPQDAVDADTLAALAHRIRSAIDEPDRADLRDLALVTLVVHTQSLFGVLHGVQWSPAGLARGYMTRRREDGLALDALDTYKRFLRAQPGPADVDPHWAETAADGISRLAGIVDDRPTGGG